VPTSDVSTTPAWTALVGRPSLPSLRQLFDADPDRGERLVAGAADLRIDYSKHRVDDGVIAALLDVARAAGVEARRDAMFRGDRINVTEDRAVLHVALRAPRDVVIEVDGTDVVAGVHEPMSGSPTW
jgi:glucose-6-phosphate isomerase